MNSHLNDDQLVLFYYRESDERDRVASHLEECQSCRTKFLRLESTLGGIPVHEVPARGEQYGADVWQRIRGRLPEKRRFDWKLMFRPQPLAAWAAIAALILLAFLMGRFTRHQETPVEQAITAQDRERILLVSVENHLEISQRVLMEILNTPTDGSADISQEQLRAEDLLESNRLYRQVAVRSGNAGVADVLDQLERVLLEITNRPSRISAGDLEGMRRHVDEQGLLFKMRVIDSQMQQRERAVSLSIARSQT
jgi:hypothetical protein